MSDAQLNFNELLRRGNDRFRGKERQIPSEFFQCVAFYGQSVLDELDVNFSPKRKWWGPWKNDYQTVMSIQEALSQQKFIFPFYSKEVFMSQQEATNFLPLFVKQLIKDEKIPPTVIKDDRSVDEEVLKLGIVPLTITILEEAKEEFKGFANQ